MHRYDVLGPLRVDGEAAAAPSRPAQRRLLALLLLQQRHGPVSRDQLVDGMWPTGAPNGAVNTLQAHVSGLRRLLGRDAVVTDRHGYRVVVAPDGVDADRFLQLVEGARQRRTRGDDEAALQACDQAIALWRGTPFDDLAGDATAVAEIRRLEEAATAVRSLRTAVLLDLGQPREATVALEGLLAEHPHRERLWELLMLAHYRTGRSADALAAYRDARAALGELGLEPGRPLRDLERRMLVQDPTLLPTDGWPGTGRAPTSAAARLDQGVHAWPLVDRDQELVRLDAVVDGHSPGAVLMGPAGVGKTRLLREAERRAPTHTTTILVRANASLRSVPLGAVADIVRLAPGPVAAQADQLLAALRQTGSGAPVLLLVDDAHHLDDGTLGLLARGIEGRVVRVIATVRTGQHVPDAITAWWKDLGLTRLHVGPLDAEPFGELLERVLGPTATATRDRLVELAAGNPLHLREAIRAARDDGALVHEDGQWQLVRDVIGSGRLSELVDNVLQGLSRQSRHGLEVLALARPTSRAVVDEVAGGAVDDLQRAGLVVLDVGEGDGVVVDVVHPLYVENLAARMGPDRRRELACRVAAALERLGFPRQGDLLLAAMLGLESGELDLDLARRASREALIRMDPRLAAALAEAAVAGDDAESWLLLGRARSLLGDYAGADTALEQAAARATAAQLVAIDSEQAAAIAFGQREPARAVALLDDALRTRVVDDPVAARLRVERALYLAMSGRMEEVLEAVSSLRALPLPPVVRLTVGLGDTLARIMLGRVAGVLDDLAALESLVAAAESDLPTARDQLAYNRAEALVLVGQLDRAQAWCEAWRDRASAAGALLSLWQVTALRVAEGRGQVAQGLALDHAHADAFARSPDPFAMGPLRAGFRVLLLAQAGELAMARTVLRSVDEASLRGDARNAALLRMARAWTCLPDLDAAARAFTEAGRLASAQGHAAWGVHAWYGAVRVGRPELAVEALDEAVDRMPGADLVATLRDSAVAHATGDLRALRAVARRFTAHGARLLAAEAHAEASRRAAADGSLGLAAECRRDAAASAEGLGARTPGLAGVLDVPPVG